MITKAKEKICYGSSLRYTAKGMFKVVGTLLSRQETVLHNISDSVELSNTFAIFFIEKGVSFEQA